MLEMNSNILIIPVYVNILNPAVKRQRCNRINPVMFYFQETHLNLRKVDCIGTKWYVKKMQTTIKLV